MDQQCRPKGAIQGVEGVVQQRMGLTIRSRHFLGLSVNQRELRFGKPEEEKEEHEHNCKLERMKRGLSSKQHKAILARAQGMTRRRQKHAHEDKWHRTKPILSPEDVSPSSSSPSLFLPQIHTSPCSHPRATTLKASCHSDQEKSQKEKPAGSCCRKHRGQEASRKAKRGPVLQHVSHQNLDGQLCPPCLAPVGPP